MRCTGAGSCVIWAGNHATIDCSNGNRCEVHCGDDGNVHCPNGACEVYCGNPCSMNCFNIMNCGAYPGHQVCGVTCTP